MKCAMAVLALLLLAPQVYAWEKRENPDRYPSLGVELAKGQEAGIRRDGTTNGGTVGFKADFRAPVTGSLTLHVSGESIGINNNLEYTSGYRLAVGMRVYIKD